MWVLGSDSNQIEPAETSSGSSQNAPKPPPRFPTRITVSSYHPKQYCQYHSTTTAIRQSGGSYKARRASRNFVPRQTKNGRSQNPENLNNNSTFSPVLEGSLEGFAGARLPRESVHVPVSSTRRISPGSVRSVTVYGGAAPLTFEENQQMKKNNSRGVKFSVFSKAKNINITDIRMELGGGGFLRKRRPRSTASAPSPCCSRWASRSSCLSQSPPMGWPRAYRGL